MDLPKFLIADNSELKDTLFIIHTLYPRFFLNVINDEIHWMEEFDKEDKLELESQTARLVEEAPRTSRPPWRTRRRPPIERRTGLSSRGRSRGTPIRWTRRRGTRTSSCPTSPGPRGTAKRTSSRGTRVADRSGSLKSRGRSP